MITKASIAPLKGPSLTGKICSDNYLYLKIASASVVIDQNGIILNSAYFV